MSTSYANQKQIAELHANFLRALPAMSPEVMQSWIENPKALSAVLDQKLNSPEESSPFPVWKTVKTNIEARTTDNIQHALKKAGVKSKLSPAVFSEHSLTMEVKLRLVNVSVEELGFAKPTKWENIHMAANAKGLLLCPSVVAALLATQHPDALAPDKSCVIATRGHVYTDFGIGYETTLMRLTKDTYGKVEVGMFMISYATGRNPIESKFEKQTRLVFML